MDREEAYRIPTTHLRQALQEAIKDNRIITDYGRGGTMYSIELWVEQGHANRTYLHGTIHNNNSNSYELIKERIEIENK